jgi:hypothetical protein
MGRNLSAMKRMSSIGILRSADFPPNRLTWRAAISTRRFLICIEYICTREVVTMNEWTVKRGCNVFEASARAEVSQHAIGVSCKTKACKVLGKRPLKGDRSLTRVLRRNSFSKQDGKWSGERSTMGLSARLSCFTVAFLESPASGERLEIKFPREGGGHPKIRRGKKSNLREGICPQSHCHKG